MTRRTLILRVTPAELRVLRLAARMDGRTAPAWARDLAVAAARVSARARVRTAIAAARQLDLPIAPE